MGTDDDDDNNNDDDDDDDDDDLAPYEVLVLNSQVPFAGGGGLIFVTTASEALTSSGSDLGPPYRFFRT